MSNLPLFQQTQYAFSAHIRDPENNARPNDVEERRMNIYNELFYNNVEDFISNTYPVLKEITDEEDWDEMLRDYFSKHLSHTPLFPEMPREFLKYLENERNNENDPPFMLELAHYEWVELALMTSDLDENINWDNIDQTADLLDAQPVLSPLAWPLTYEYPVQHISEDFIPEEPLATPVYLLVYRDKQDEVHFMELNPITALLIQLINDDNDFTTKQMLENIAEQMNHPNKDVVIEGGLQIINYLKQRNVILGVNKS
ncbi:MAG: putative DNA-binding domain-containing protein [Woeseiaceae bacterium]